ncbi:hypothetical protein [Desulfatibacillum aliphaticivorans]|uniref:hypothetical protein n=1 Tax=Desulfatibacillum aliphaticivorans TaxID=218208 RepID=UPI0004803FC2|nr:hypothetical protein [Desulfatibacillum aliphaticivorans]
MNESYVPEAYRITGKLHDRRTKICLDGSRWMEISKNPDCTYINLLYGGPSPLPPVDLRIHRNGDMEAISSDSELLTKTLPGLFQHEGDAVAPTWGAVVLFDAQEVKEETLMT